MRKSKNKFCAFLLLCTSCAFLVLDYNKIIFRPFNFGSFDVRTKTVLSAVLQLVAFKDTFVKPNLGNYSKLTNFTKITQLLKIVLYA